MIVLLVPLTSGFSSLPEKKHRRLALSKDTIHWGYFSKLLPPQLTIASGETVVVEMASHHACDDYDKMVQGDAGMESIFEWSTSVKAVSRRGANGGGDGVHVLTGPIYVQGAEPGDILSVEIVDLAPRPNAEGKTFGSNAAAWWGYQARSNKVHGAPLCPRHAWPALTHSLTHSLPRWVGLAGGRHGVHRGCVHQPHDQRRGGDHLRALRGGRQGLRHAELPVRVAHDHRPRGRRARLHQVPGHLRAARLRGLLGRGDGHGLEQGRRDLVRVRAVPGQDPGQHARGLHGPRARLARQRRLDPADADGRQPRRQAHRQGHDHVLPGRGRGGAALDGRRAHGAGRLGARRHGHRDEHHGHLQDPPHQGGRLPRAVDGGA